MTQRRLKYLGDLKATGDHDFRSPGKQPQSKNPQRGGIKSWPKEDITSDIKTRRLLTVCGGLHPKSSIQRLDTKWKEGGRGLVSLIILT